MPSDFVPDLLLAVDGLVKTYPGVQALDGVDLQMRRGEVRALLGENGSGKSTFAKILYGACKPDAGQVTFAGEVLPFGSPGKARSLGIAAISQELTLAPELSITENVLMGRLPSRGGRIDWHGAHAQTAALLSEMDLEVDPRRSVGSLTVEVQQEVEITRAFAQPAQLLILDEATSALSSHAADRLLARVATASAAGCAVLFITHRMQEIRQVAERATVLRDGKLIGTVDLEEASDDDLLRMMVGREITRIYGSRRKHFGPVALSARGLQAADGAFNRIDISVRAGEIVGISGLSGCGKSELGLALFGARELSGGTISIAGEEVEGMTVANAIRSGIGYVPPDRKRHGLLPNRSVTENLSLPWHRLSSKLGVIRAKPEAGLTETVIQSLGVKTRTAGTRVELLSGGNQQKLLLGRWFPLNPKVLILDEPTRGVDVGAKVSIYAAIQELAEEGLGVLLIASELPEVLGLADRVYVMYEGEIVTELDGASTSEEEVTAWAIGKARVRVE